MILVAILLIIVGTTKLATLSLINEALDKTRLINEPIPDDLIKFIFSFDGLLCIMGGIIILFI